MESSGTLPALRGGRTPSSSRTPAQRITPPPLKRSGE
jgi:hypothetical protein